MTTTSIQLSDQESAALHELAQQTGKTQAEMIQEAVTSMLVRIDPTLRRELL